MMTSPETAVSAAQAGLDAVYKEFVIGDVPLLEAMVRLGTGVGRASRVPATGRAWRRLRA
jgi:hypothetical protein